MSEENTSELAGIVIDTTQNETQEEESKRKMNRSPVGSRTTLSSLVYQ